MDARHVVFKLVVWKLIALNFISLAINSTNKGYNKQKVRRQNNENADIND